MRCAEQNVYLENKDGRTLHRVHMAISNEVSLLCLRATFSFNQAADCSI